MIKGLELTESQQQKTRICFHEAVSNAVIHGNQLDNTKHVLIHREIVDSTLIFKITDQGTGFDYTKIKNPLASENLGAPNGRGLLLVNEMACQSAYCNKSKTMKLEFNLSSKTSNV